ncbi:alpha/beta fold hydrolase [Aspergillus undulatus]|uniref:alpha/beta fold hydrolase n=1 Tax=Aspergillus undulatus TaxID=1810928 RepID=UPI003CCE3078
MTIRVPVTARNGVFNNVPTPMTNLEATVTYPIGATYCMPGGEEEGSHHTLQILTHGIGFDRSYWDIPFGNYSYVDAAVSRGYHTLFYDRLGIGMSAHGNPKNETQSFVELEALAQMTRLAGPARCPISPSLAEWSKLATRSAPRRRTP